MANIIKTSEAVLPGHPDKIADCVSDKILDAVLTQDPQGRCAVETLVTGNTLVVAGEISAKGGNLNVPELVRTTLLDLGYSDSKIGFNAFSCEIANLLTTQSPDLARLQSLGPAVAGDQGIMYGYATRESPDFLPLQLSVARQVLFDFKSLNLPDIYHDGKALVSIAFPDGDMPRLQYIGISVHTSWSSKELKDLSSLLVEGLRKEYLGYLSIPTFFKIEFNPAGPFTVGGPTGDTGLTGRKIVVDQYGGEVPIGGGAFSGKDATKVDRSAAYYCRYVALNLIEANLCDKALVNVSYMIGQDGPKYVNLNTFGTNKTKWSDKELIDRLLKADVFDFRVEKIIDELGLRNPIYYPTAKYGHFGIRPWLGRADGFNLDLVGKAFKETLPFSVYSFFPWEVTNRKEKILEAL